MLTQRQFVGFSLLAMTAISCQADQGFAAENDLFERRIAPLARAVNGSSCRECHVAGVDLSQYILPTEAETFAALRAGGLVDVAAPEKSKLLTFIARQSEKPDPLLVKIRAEELAAFREWIAQAAKNPALLAAKPSAKPVGPSDPLEVVRHARHDRVLQSFVENIWIETERCLNCHSPTKNQRQVQEYGEQISWISPDDPAGTLARCIENGLFDLDNPDNSLLLQKPLGEVKHAGHIKFSQGSRTDRQFRQFLHDYAAVVRGKYASAADLPKVGEIVVLATGQHLRITAFPSPLGLRMVRVDLFAQAGNGWTKSPVGTVDGRIVPKTGQFQSLAFAIVPRSETGAQDLLRQRQLPGIRYLARIYVDRENRLPNDRDYVLGESDLWGEVEFEGPWKPGYQPPKIVAAPPGAWKP